MIFDVRSMGLPKWPAMVVVGEDVTSDQAAEILVRTDSWGLGTNDKAWERRVREIANLPSPWEPEANIEVMKQRWAREELFRADLGALSLEYLSNSWIASAYIGGPHGWCDWNGRIYSVGHNIGKWPGAEMVLDEWQKIAAAFPYLKLWCQLYNGEQCELGVRPIVEYVVAEGRATAQAPTAREVQSSERDISAEVRAIAIGMAGRERGCTAEQLERALHIARAARAAALTSGTK